MTLAITHRGPTTAVLDAVREARPPFSPEEVVGQFSAVLTKYGITRHRGPVCRPMAAGTVSIPSHPRRPCGPREK